MSSNVEAKNAIQMGHLANLAAVAAAIPEASREAVTIGYVVGRADGLSFRANPNGDEPSVGLTGIFEATPADPTRSIMVAKTIFLPKSFMDTMIPILESKMSEADMKKIPRKAPPKGKSIDLKATDVIPLQLEIGIRRNNGAGVGYEFAVLGKRDPAAQDILADLRSDFIPKELAAPATAAPKALAAPKKKGKK